MRALVLALLLASSAAHAADVPDFVSPDPALLAALPAEQREALLQGALMDAATPDAAERLMAALVVSQRFDEATSATTPELLPTLTDALSADEETRNRAVERAGVVMPPVSVSAAAAQPTTSLSGGPPPTALPPTRDIPLRLRSLQHMQRPNSFGGRLGTHVVRDARGRGLDALDLARVLGDTSLARTLEGRKVRMVLGIGAGGGAVGLGYVLLIGGAFAGSIALMSVGGLLVIGGFAMVVALPLRWNFQKYQLDLWYDSDDLVAKIAAHNAAYAVPGPHPQR